MPAISGISQEQGLNPCPLHWQIDSYSLYQQGSPQNVYEVVGPIEVCSEWFEVLNCSLSNLSFSCLLCLRRNNKKPSIKGRFSSVWFTFWLLKSKLSHVKICNSPRKSSRTFFFFFFNRVKKNNGLPWWLRWWRISLQCAILEFNPWIRKIPWRWK